MWLLTPGFLQYTFFTIHIIHSMVDYPSVYITIVSHPLPLSCPTSLGLPPYILPYSLLQSVYCCRRSDWSRETPKSYNYKKRRNTMRRDGTWQTKRWRWNCPVGLIRRGLSTTLIQINYYFATDKQSQTKIRTLKANTLVKFYGEASTKIEAFSLMQQWEFFKCPQHHVGMYPWAFAVRNK
jgi:hypothetical protein